MVGLLDPVPHLIIALTCALLFGTAAWHKLGDFAQFRAALSAYRLLPAAFEGPLGWLLPLTESLIAAALLVDICRPYAALLGCILLLTYAAGMALNLARGRVDLSCGCGGPGEHRPIAVWMVWRNGLIAAVLALDIPGPSPRFLDATDVLSIGAAVGVMILLYSALTQLLSLSMSGGIHSPGKRES